MSEEIHKVQFIMPPTPSAKDQLKDATVATVIGLAPLAVLTGGLLLWAKVAEKREERKNRKDVSVVEEVDAE